MKIREVSPSTRLVSKVTLAAFLRPGKSSDVNRTYYLLWCDFGIGVDIGIGIGIGDVLTRLWLWLCDCDFGIGDVLVTRRKLHPDSLELVSQNLSTVFRLCPAHVRQSERPNIIGHIVLAMQTLENSITDGGSTTMHSKALWVDGRTGSYIES